MIRRNQEMRTERCEHLKGGDGCVELIHILNEDEMYGMGRFFGLTRLPPGASNGLHTHHGDFETYYILSGEALYDDNKRGMLTMKPGETSFCPDGEGHSIENPSADTDLVFMALISKTVK